MRIHNRDYLKDRRIELRNNLTPAEAVLWNALKSKQLYNRKFRRQHSIRNFIVDFYCPAEKLIIERDGEAHNNIMTLISDDERDETLANMGFRVVRFENSDVLNNLEFVLEEISNCFTTPNPSYPKTDPEF